MVQEALQLCGNIICFICIACQPKHDISKPVRNHGPSDEVKFLQLFLLRVNEKIDSTSTSVQ